MPEEGRGPVAEVVQGESIPGGGDSKCKTPRWNVLDMFEEQNESQWRELGE